MPRLRKHLQDHAVVGSGVLSRRLLVVPLELVLENLSRTSDGANAVASSIPKPVMLAFEARHIERVGLDAEEMIIALLSGHCCVVCGVTCAQAGEPRLKGGVGCRGKLWGPSTEALNAVCTCYDTIAGEDNAREGRDSHGRRLTKCA